MKRRTFLQCVSAIVPGFIGLNKVAELPKPVPLPVEPQVFPLHGMTWYPASGSIISASAKSHIIDSLPPGLRKIHDYRQKGIS
jgi:hypothetical protein